MLLSIYGLLSASFFVTLDAVDVAFTEAAVGAGISGLLMLVAISITGRKEQKSKRKPFIALLVVLLTALLLFYGISDMPYFGATDAPIHNHVAPRYIQDSMAEVGIPNIVTSVLATYRAFDTFGEVVVIFTAGIGVFALLSTSKSDSNSHSHTKNIISDQNAMDKRHLVIRIVTKILFPFILLFALYVQFHGDFGPGGGFQAGVVFAAAVILYAMLFGMKEATKVFSQSLVQVVAAIGVLLYASVGVATLLLGGDFFDYNYLASDPIAGQHIGILVIELGVGCTVAAVMMIIFFSFNDLQEQSNADNNKEPE
jgi:multicomponent Na+:H+ antiporter subunit B